MVTNPRHMATNAFRSLRSAGYHVTPQHRFHSWRKQTTPWLRLHLLRLPWQLESLHQGASLSLLSHHHLRKKNRCQGVLKAWWTYCDFIKQVIGHNLGGSIDSDRTNIHKYCVYWILTNLFEITWKTKYGEYSYNFRHIDAGVLR